MWQTLQNLVQQYGDNKLVIAIVSAFLGVVLTKSLSVNNNYLSESD